ncbi:MAG TPA: hypothetical protein VF656_13020 [Pyrinomonadaceae bacterium]|jgi:hypothetical protein
MNEQTLRRVEPMGASMPTLAPPARRQKFLRRQWEGEPTLSQLIFDVTVGMVLPVLCLVFDPLVFRGGFFTSRPMFDGYQFLGYGLIGIEILALGVWLVLGRRAGEWCGVLGGAMMAGAVFSLGIGILLLPLSVLGLMFFIGALGFTPLFTAFIYWRNARRALKSARARLSRAGVCLTLALGAIIPLGAPAFAQWRVNSMLERSLPEVLGGDERRAAAAARRLSYVSPFVTSGFDPLVAAYQSETDPARRERLARAYRDITGDEIESRLYRLND